MPRRAAPIGGRLTARPPTSSSPAQASPGWRLPESSRWQSPARRPPARRCFCSTATKSASALPPRAPRRPTGYARWGWRNRSARRSRAWRFTPPAVTSAIASRGAGRRLTTGICASCCSGRRGRGSRPRPSADEAARPWRPTAARSPRRWSWTRSAGDVSSGIAATSRRTRPCRAASRCIRAAAARTSTCGSTARSFGAGTAGAFQPATSSGWGRGPTNRAATSSARPSTSPAASGVNRSGIRGTGSRIACARPPRTASSSPATRPDTAFHCRARASGRRSTSAAPAGESCGRCSTASHPSARRSRATRVSATSIAAPSRWRSGSSA